MHAKKWRAWVIFKTFPQQAEIFTFLVLLCGLFASGHVQLQLLTHHLLAVQLHGLLHVLLRCKVNVAELPAGESQRRAI